MVIFVSAGFAGLVEVVANLVSGARVCSFPFCDRTSVYQRIKASDGGEQL